ncbi:PREDICTED: putative gamma-glutamylcyclotransferase CG2811 isoform X1 [Polistes canadensis]|uniref:putative gamma-glutamylcyclotransferase CG2811 isoform X1 n=1 Tax=Polistes canadensis TaxID=91411 RepID=UPI000718CD84|nr:PREDICTED: putative gamma-glutamylcyclotransferase CG2811 isoform X1 [Polistes canadensis]
MIFRIASAVLLTSITVLEFCTIFNYATNDSSLLNENPLHRIFVYGTLKRGEPNHKLIQDKTNGYAKFLGIAKTTSSYPLIIATKYNIPFLLKKPGVGHHVIGEIYDVDSKMLTKLDELEEHPNFYERTKEDVFMAPESKLKHNKNIQEVGMLTKAWIYFLPKFRSSLLEVPIYESYSNEGNHGLKYGEKYVRDPMHDHRNEVQ